MEIAVTAVINGSTYKQGKGLYFDFVALPVCFFLNKRVFTEDSIAVKAINVTGVSFRLFV